MKRLTYSLLFTALVMAATAAGTTLAAGPAGQSSGTLCGELPAAATAGSPDALVENGPRLRWSTPVPEYIYFVVAIGDDQIGLAIVPDSRSSTAIIVLDAATWNVNWCQELEWQEIGALGSVDGVVVARSREENPDDPGQTIAFDARSGAELWRLDRALPMPFQFEGDVILLEIVEDESQVFLNGIEPLTGQARWQLEMPPGSIASWLAIANGLVYLPVLPVEGQPEHRILALDASTGEQRWSTAIEFDFEFFGVSSSPSGMLYGYGAVGGFRECFVLAMDGETGNEVWRSVETTVQCTFPLVTDQMLFFGFFFAFAAFDSASGEELWRAQLNQARTGGPIEGSAVVTEDQLVIVGTAYESTVPDGWPVVGVDVETGDVLWELVVDRPDLNEIPAPILAGGAVIVVSTEILALEI
jgi:outer membrane protein assembly factor BamB